MRASAVLQPAAVGRPEPAPAPSVPSAAAGPAPSGPRPLVPRPPVPRGCARLAGRLDALDLRLHALERAGGAHVDDARRHWAAAWGRLAAGEVDAAWQLRDAAERALLAGEDAAALDDHATALAAECADKLAGWRARAVAALCAPEPDLAARRARLARATWLRDEHMQVHIQKVGRMRQQLLALSGVLAAALAAAVAVLWACGLAFETPADDAALRGGPMLALVALFGATGGAFSAAVGVAGGRAAGRVPDQIVAGYTALLRPLLGAAGAVAFYAFLRAGLGVQPSSNVLGAYAFWAFAAGFSERLLARTVDTAADRVGGGPADGPRGAERGA